MRIGGFGVVVRGCFGAGGGGDTWIRVAHADAFLIRILFSHGHVCRFCREGGGGGGGGHLFFSEVPKVDMSGFGNRLFN